MVLRREGSIMRARDLTNFLAHSFIYRIPAVSRPLIFFPRSVGGLYSRRLKFSRLHRGYDSVSRSNCVTCARAGIKRSAISKRVPPEVMGYCPHAITAMERRAVAHGAGDLMINQQDMTTRTNHASMGIFRPGSPFSSPFSRPSRVSLQRTLGRLDRSRRQKDFARSAADKAPLSPGDLLGGVAVSPGGRWGTR